MAGAKGYKGVCMVCARERFGAQIRLYWKDALGLALYLGWVYSAFFGCGLAEMNLAVVNQPTTWSLERLWMAAGAAQAIGAVVGTAVDVFSRKFTDRDISRPVHLVALICGIAGLVLLWAAWLNGAAHFDDLLWLGGGLSGLAMAFFTMAWGRRLSSFDEMRIEATVPMAFVLAFAIYLVMLFWRVNDVVDLVIVCCMAVGSFLLLTPRSADAPQGSMPVSAQPHVPVRNDRTQRGMLSFLLLMAALWFQVAYFRVLATPALSGNRFTHYLYPFLISAVASVVMLALCIRVSRYLNITLAYRWSLPLFVLAYVPVLVDYGNPTLRIAAYTINFLGMFGVQFGCWIGAAKYVRRSRTNPAATFGAFALGEGLGVFGGCALGLYAVRSFAGPTLMSISMLVLGVVELMVLVVGFNPNWTFNRTARGADRKALASVEAVESVAVDETAGATVLQEAPIAVRPADLPVSTLAEVLRVQAEALQRTYGLTSRETEVTVLLLAGRTRAYIRDELFVSLNTVGVHVRNIFAKCGVHSVQELMDLARHEENAMGQ